MKVAHVTESFGGGCVVAIATLIRGLPNHQHVVIQGVRKDEPELDTFTSLFGDATRLIKWKYTCREINLIKDFLSFVYLLILLIKEKPDLVHLHSSKAGFIGRLVCFFLSIKCVYSTHGVSLLRKDVRRLKLKLFYFLEWIGSKFPCTIVSTSPSERELLMNKGIKSIVICNGIEVNKDTISNFEEAVPQILHTSIPKLVFCNVARITEQKNPILFNQIAESNLHHQFIWVGDGKLRNVLVSPNIIVTGWKNKNEVMDILSQSHIFLSTALWEGLPFSVLEAMSMGKPLLLSSCVGNVDLVQNNENGFIYHSLEEVNAYIKVFEQQPYLLRTFGKNSLKLCLEKYSAKEMCANFDKLYFSLINDK